MCLPWRKDAYFYDVRGRGRKWFFELETGSVGLDNTEKNSLTVGHLHACSSRSRAREMCITTCTGLKARDAMGCYVRGDLENDISLAPSLTQLTKIAVHHNGKFLTDLACLTLMQHLDLFVQSDKDCSLDEVLECMPSLQIIQVMFCNENQKTPDAPVAARLRLSGSALSAIHPLKSVGLRDVDVDGHFFHALASKTGLTKLKFTSSRHRGYSRSFISQVNLVRNLEELTIWSRENYNESHLPSPEDLPKLTWLMTRPEDKEGALRWRFNRSLRRVLVNGEKESAWRSRLAAS